MHHDNEDFQDKLEKVYQSEKAKLKSFLYRLICDRTIVEDLVQDTFVKALEKRHQYRGSASLKTWIFSIATRLALDYMKSKKRWPIDAQDQARALAESDKKHPEKFLQLNQTSAHGTFEIREHINFCFTCISKTLPIEQQVTLMLKDVYGFKIYEISLIMDCPKGTSKDRLFKARKKMNKIFEHRCALINKNGICYQCSELNDFFNPGKKSPAIDLIPEDKHDKSGYYQLRTQLIKSIDPLESSGNELEDAIMQVLRQAIQEK